ncbi:MAG: DUF2029 domain-containing protein [Candidatus Eisenbacteria bacterium]|nr:DUF2029 domain-containing protein [Candidatus Eisenbacteria bacterium]
MRRYGPVARVLMVVALLLHAFLLLSVTTQSRPVVWALHNDMVHRQGPAADFFSIYHASASLSDGRSPYSFEDDGRTPYFFPYRYMPIVAQMGRLMLWIPPMAAYHSWVILLEVMLVVLIILVWRVLTGWRRVFGVCCLLLSTPYFLEVYMGQFTFATTALLAFSLVSSACLVYVLAVLLKMYPLAAGVAFVRTRRWKCFALAAVALGLLTIPYFATHLDDLRAFRALNLKVPAGVAGGLHSGNYGFAYLLYLLLKGSGLSPAWPAFTGILHVFLLGATAVVVFMSRDKRLVVGACAMVLAHFAGYAQVWEHHYSGVIVLGVLLLSQWRDGSRLVPVTVAALVLMALPTPFALFDVARDPAVWDPSTDWSLGASVAVVIPKALPLFALYVASMVPLLAAGVRSPREALRSLGRETA